MQQGHGQDLASGLTQKEALKRPLFMPSTEGKFSSVKAKVPRPLSLPSEKLLEDPLYANFASRPTSIFISDETCPGNLISDNGKTNYMKNLQDKSHHWHSEASVLNGREVDIEGGTPGRSLIRGLSPVKAQSIEAPGLNRIDLKKTYKKPCNLNLLRQKRVEEEFPIDCNRISSDELKSKRDHLSEFAQSLDAPNFNVTDESESRVPFSEIRVPSNINKAPLSEKQLKTDRNVSRSSSFSSDENSHQNLNKFSEELGATHSSANQNSDVMGCERHLTAKSRGPFKDTSLNCPHKTSTPRDEKCHGADKMGSLFSRGSSVSTPPASPKITLRSPRVSALRGLKQTPVEEKPLPSYVRHKPEPPRKYAGFAHVNSSNVKRMRDVWGLRQEKSSPASSPKPYTIPPSYSLPTASSYRRSVEFSKNHDPDSPLYSPCHTPTDRHRSSTPNKKSPSPESSLYFQFPDRANNSPVNKRSSSVGAPKKPKSPPYISRLASRGDSGSPSPVNSPTVSRRFCQRDRESSTRASSASSRSRTPISPSPKSPSTPTDIPYTLKGPPTPTRTSASRINVDKNNENNNKNDHKKKNNLYARRTKDNPKLSRNSPPSPVATKAHHKIFKRLRDANLQPDSEAICFKEEEDKYKVSISIVITSFFYVMFILLNILSAQLQPNRDR